MSQSIDADKMISEIHKLSESFNDMRKEIGKVIVGQGAVIDQVLVTILSGGHCLILGVPGLAKTLLIRCLGEVMDLEFNRIQFTPDLMPSDITGTEVLDEEVGSARRSLRFVKGPVFTNILLADEINRTPPKTQAALLEAMQERHVTSGGMKFELPSPFFVLATQNPIEQEGTYPLPEAQLDRFMFLVRMDYPGRLEEIRIIGQTTINRDVKLKHVINGPKILELQRIVRDIPVSGHVIAYAADLVRMSRPSCAESPDFIRKNLNYGAGPRAGQYLILAAKAWAGLNGRVNVCCEDVRRSVHSVMFHRVACNFHAAGEGIGPTEIINKLIAEVPEPVGE
jgi:MoxR-like ATPase